MSSPVLQSVERSLAIGRLGLLAGEGAFPLMVARAARSHEVSVVAVGVEGLTIPDLEAEVDVMHWVRFGQFDSMIRVLQGEGITKLILAGRIKHNSIFQWTRIDARGRRLMARVATRKADSLLAAVTQEFANENIEVLDSTLFLRGCMPGAGLLTPKAPPDARVRQDIEFGLKDAREIARLDIGQTIVVKNKSVVAVEAMEGTDRTIARAAELAGEGIVVVKVNKPNQDRRFDVPVVGSTTINGLIAARAAALAFPADEILFFDRAESCARAENHGVTVIAV